MRVGDHNILRSCAGTWPMNAMGGAFEDWTKAVEAATAEADAAMASPLRAVSTEKNLDWTFIIPPRIRRSVSRSAARVIPPGSTGAGIMFVGVDDEELAGLVWSRVTAGKHIAFAHITSVSKALSAAGVKFLGRWPPLQIHFGSKVF